MKRLLTVLAVLAVAPTSVWAQTRTNESKKEVPTTKMDFDGAQIEGNRAGPLGSTIDTRRKVEFENRIKVRSSFQVELRQSVEKL